MSYLQQLVPWSGINPNGQKASFFWLFIRPWPLILYPAVAYATLVFGFAISALLMVVVTGAEVFQSPPYNFGPGIQSLMFLFGVIGGLLGSMWGGYGTDVLTRYRSSKNNGIFEPENRLIMLVAPLLLGPAGVLMYHSSPIVLNNAVGMASVVGTSNPGFKDGLDSGLLGFLRLRSLRALWHTVCTCAIELKASD
jgi:hypothetical protein